MSIQGVALLTLVACGFLWINFKILHVLRCIKQHVLICWYLSYIHTIPTLSVTQVCTWNTSISWFCIFFTYLSLNYNIKFNMLLCCHMWKDNYNSSVVTTHVHMYFMCISRRIVFLQIRWHLLSVIKMLFHFSAFISSHSAPVVSNSWLCPARRSAPGSPQPHVESNSTLLLCSVWVTYFQVVMCFTTAKIVRVSTWSIYNTCHIFDCKEIINDTVHFCWIVHFIGS